jgi:cell division protein FtsB
MKEKWQGLRQNIWFKWFSNVYVLGSLIFLVWMTFLDVNSFIIHAQLNQELDELKNSIEYYQAEIEKDKRQLDELNSEPEKLEKFAREEFYLHQPNEIVYIINNSD